METPGLFVFLMLSCMNCLHMLDANTFFHSVGCPFILFIVSFAVKKLLSLTRFHLFIFCFYLLYFRRQTQSMLLQFMSECSVFSAKGFMVSDFILRSLIHFEFIFEYGVR